MDVWEKIHLQNNMELLKGKEIGRVVKLKVSQKYQLINKGAPIFILSYICFPISQHLGSLG